MYTPEGRPSGVFYVGFSAAGKYFHNRRKVFSFSHATYRLSFRYGTPPLVAVIVFCPANPFLANFFFLFLPKIGKKLLTLGDF
jgi:hypothetical protein